MNDENKKTENNLIEGEPWPTKKESAADVILKEIRDYMNMSRKGIYSPGAILDGLNEILRKENF